MEDCLSGQKCHQVLRNPSSTAEHDILIPAPHTKTMRMVHHPNNTWSLIVLLWSLFIEGQGKVELALYIATNGLQSTIVEIQSGPTVYGRFT